MSIHYSVQSADMFLDMMNNILLYRIKSNSDM